MDPVGITNLALLKIGAQAQVSSINPSDGSTEGDSASILYQPTMDALMRAAHWNFTRRQVDGTLIAASYNTPENASQTLPQPLKPWLYSYAVPNDCLKVRYLLPQFDNATAFGNPIPISTYNGLSPYLYLNPIMVGAIPYITGIDLDSGGNEVKVILTNLENAQIVYTARISNCDLWDVSFIQASSAALAAELVNAIARNAQLSAEMQRLAMTYVNQARVSDGNEGITTVNREAVWMDARTGVGLCGYGDYYGGWDDMGWSGGV